MKHRASLETHYKHLYMYCQLYSYIDVVDADSANDANVSNNNVSNNVANVSTMY